MNLIKWNRKQKSKKTLLQNLKYQFIIIFLNNLNVIIIIITFFKFIKTVTYLSEKLKKSNVIREKLY